MTSKFKVLGLVMVLVLALIAAPAAHAANFHIITDTVANGRVGDSYSQTLRATQFNGVTWRVAGGALPKGLYLNESTGVIYGTPQEDGTFQFTISASNGNWADARSFAITVGRQPIQIKITRSVLNAGTIDEDYADVITANVTGVTFSIIEGSLPSGLYMDTAGVITGIPTANSRTSSFTVRASTKDADAVSDTKRFTITIAANPVDILTNVLPNGTEKSDYVGELIANKSGVTWSWTAAEGSSLPGGLTLGSDGTISGQPSSGGVYEFIVTATDGQTTAAKSFVIDVTPLQQVIVYVPTAPDVPETFQITTTSPLPDGTVNTPYNGGMFNFEVSPAGLSGVTYSVANRNLPGNMTLSGQGILTGSPNEAGVFYFEVIARYNGKETPAKLFQLTVNPTGGSVHLTSSTELYATKGRTFRTQFTSNVDGTKWEIEGGEPAGLTLNGDTGLLIGEPQNAGTIRMRVKYTAPNGQGNTSTVLLIVEEDSSNGSSDSNGGSNGGRTQTGTSVTLKQTTVPIVRNATMNIVNLEANTDKTIVEWSAIGLPTGITCDSMGRLSGRTSTAGTFKVNVTLTTDEGDILTSSFYLQVAGDNSEDDDDDGDCNAGISLYALSLVGSFFLLRRKH